MKSLLKKLVIFILTWEARLVLKRYRPKIIAITGSVGKTGTKDAIYSVLAGHFHVRKSERSFNSDFGVPLTILGLRLFSAKPILWLRNIYKGLGTIVKRSNYPEWLVVEVGAGEPGDIKRFGKLLKPDAVVVTRLAKVPVHVEFFSSPEEVMREKGHLVSSLKDSGLLVLNADDQDVLNLREYKRISKLVSFGLSDKADFQASNFEIFYEEANGRIVPRGFSFKMNYGGNSVPIAVRGAVGRHQAYPVAAALAVGQSLGLNMVEMAEALKKYEPPRGRMKIVEGEKLTTLIDDTYNASPVAAKEALLTLREIKTSGRRIAVMGDMLELGKYSHEEHKKIGKLAKEFCDILVTVGFRSRGMAEGALESGMDEKNIFQFDMAGEAGKFVETIIKEGDIILVKGSQGMRMEKIVEEIMAHPEDKEKLLVRQEREWLGK